MPNSIEAKQRAIKARREAEAKLHKMRISSTEKSIAQCEAEIEKAQRIIENKAYGLIGNILLGAAAFIAVIGVILRLVSDVDVALVAWIIAAVVLGISIYLNTKTSFAEDRLRKNMVIMKKKRSALSELKNRHS